MPDVEITYNNSVIVSLNSTGTEVLETNGTFLVDDITVQYTKTNTGPSGMYVEYNTSGDVCNFNPNGETFIPQKMFYGAIFASSFSYSWTSVITSIYSSAFYSATTRGASINLSFPNLTLLETSNFAYVYKLNTFSAPLLETIPACCFMGCSSLMSVSIPNAKSIGGTAFSGCQNLTSVSFPLVTSLIGGQTFVSCFRMTSCYIPSLTYISGANTFSGCTGMASFSFPLLSIISGLGSNFYSCQGLKSVYFPELNSIIGSAQFWNCVQLENVYLPKWSNTSVHSGMYSSCYKLSTVSFPAATKLSGTNYFTRCYNLTSIFLLGSSLCALGNTIASVASSCPLSTYSTSAWRFTSVYVPSSLLASYKAATNWTTVSSKIFAYESFFGKIGSYGIIDNAWREINRDTTLNFSTAFNNGYKVNFSARIVEQSHYNIVFDDVVYPCATYSSNANIFGAPLSGTSYKWDYYPFHFSDDFMVAQSSGTHTVYIYSDVAQ